MRSYTNNIFDNSLVILKSQFNIKLYAKCFPFCNLVCITTVQTAKSFCEISKTLPRTGQSNLRRNFWHFWSHRIAISKNFKQRFQEIGGISHKCNQYTAQSTIHMIIHNNGGVTSNGNIRDGNSRVTPRGRVSREIKDYSEPFVFRKWQSRP